MPHLYLVQHGEAKTEAEDPERSLTDEGRQAVERMADFLSRLRLPLERIEHSDKLRARQTAEILAARLRPAEGLREVASLAPNADVQTTRLRLEAESKNIMLVGHLPHLGRLTAQLLGLTADQDVVRFRMGGVLCMERDTTGRWVIAWMVVPELLRTPSSVIPG